MISLRQVSKKFKLYRRPSDRVLEWVTFRRRHEEFWAVRGVDLEVPRGRTVGIVGANGAGKSTLLKLITGTLLPTEGRIEIVGRVAALLELGTGFHPEFTGRQNIHVNGQLLGLTPEETRDLEPGIIAFSELGPFIDQPIRTYSSGMIVRLGFSIAASVNPQVLIVDEALSVGDARFSAKCISRIRQFRDQGTTILFVSHDPGAVSLLCDEAVLLEQGTIRARGSAKEVLEEYNALQAAKGTGNVEMKVFRAAPDADPNAKRRHGTFQAFVSRMDVCTTDGALSDIFSPGETMMLRLRVDFFSPVVQPTIGFLIKDRLGMEIFGTNTALLKLDLGSFKADESVELDIRIPLQIGFGDYSLTVAVHEDETHLQACYEWTDNAALFRIRHKDKPWWSGLTILQPTYEVRRAKVTPNDLNSPLAERFRHLTDPLPMEEMHPSPFVSGFIATYDGEYGRIYAMRHETLLAIHPRMGTVNLAIRINATSATWVAFRLVGGAEIGKVLLPAGMATVSFALPKELVDRVSLFALHWWKERETDEDPALFLHRVGSSHHPEAHGEWPITTPA